MTTDPKIVEWAVFSILSKIFWRIAYIGNSSFLFSMFIHFRLRPCGESKRNLLVGKYFLFESFSSKFSWKSKKCLREMFMLRYFLLVNCSLPFANLQNERVGVNGIYEAENKIRGHFVWFQLYIMFRWNNFPIFHQRADEIWRMLKAKIAIEHFPFNTNGFEVILFDLYR